MRATITAAFLALAICVYGQQAKEYSAAETAKHVGETVTVTDKITGVYQSQGGDISLNMGGRYPNQAFTAFVPADSGAEFSRAKELDGHTVSVTGKITLNKGKPEITVDVPSQIKKKD
jgi:hypothetical protein